MEGKARVTGVQLTSLFPKLIGPVGSGYTYCPNLIGQHVTDDAVGISGLGWEQNHSQNSETEKQDFLCCLELGTLLGEQNHDIEPVQFQSRPVWARVGCRILGISSGGVIFDPTQMVMHPFWYPFR